MAVGDKKTVVMGSDLAIPGGVATLDASGKLAEAQRPDYSIEQIEGLKNALEGLADKETQNQIKRDTTNIKETQDQIKRDTINIKETQDQIKWDTTNIKETGWTILAELRGQRPKRYGYRVKISEPDPYSRVEYLFDAVGMTPAHMNYDRQEFDYGDWKDIWFVRDNYPCMVRPDGSEDYRLDPNDYTKRADGGGASGVTDTAQTSNAMAAIPLVWVKRYQEAGYQYVIFCEQQFDEGYKAYAHTRPDGTISKVAYHAMFKGSLVDGKLRSIAGQKPQGFSNATQELSYAKANGAKWTIETWSLYSLIADLLTLISKTTASQAAFGQGHTEGGGSEANFLDCGTLKDRGQFFGYSDTAHAMKVFHIENFWGERRDRLVGLIYTNGAFRAKMTPEGAGYNFTGDGYTAIGKGIIGQTENVGTGWQRDTEQTEYGRFPVGPLTGSDATFETDYLIFNNANVTVACIGGARIGGSQCGARWLSVSDPAFSAMWGLGASLSLEDPS